MRLLSVFFKSTVFFYSLLFAIFLECVLKGIYYCRTCTTALDKITSDLLLETISIFFIEDRNKPY